MKNFFRPTAGQKIISGLVTCLILAIASYFLATAMIDSLYSYRSPLRETPPQPGTSLGQPSTRRVVFVLIDGLRYDTSLNTSIMPVLDMVRQQGASATMHSRPPSYSEPGYTTLLTGAWPNLNDGPAINLDYAEIPTWTQDNIFSAAKRAGLSTAVSGYDWFEKLIPQDAVSASFYTPGEDQNADRAVVNAALPWLGQDYQLMLIHIDQVDYAGHHEGGPRSPNWNAAAARADALLAEIVSKLDLTQDTLLVASDHGHIDAGGHGGIEPVVLTEPFVLAGKGVKPGKYGDVQMVDVAPTLAALLGTNLPADAQGQPLVDLLDLPAAITAALPGAIAAQQTALLEDYTQAIGRPIPPAEIPQEASVAAYQDLLQSAVDSRLYLERGSRWAAVGFLLLLVVGIITRIKPRVLAWNFGAAALAIGLFHLRYALIDGHPYSLSWVPGQMDLILYVAITAGFSLVVGWLVAMLGLRGFRLPPRDGVISALGYIMAVFLLLALPVSISYALNGLTITWVLPDFLSYFIAFLSLLMVLITAVVGLVLAGITGIITRVISSRNSEE